MMSPSPSLIVKSLRFFSVLILSALLLSYVWTVWRKYEAGSVGVAVREKEKTAFVFPSVSVCGNVGKLMGDRRSRQNQQAEEGDRRSRQINLSWITHARQNVLVTNDDVDVEK